MWSYGANHQNLHQPDWAQRREYLLTNGLGGYASQSILGCNTRRYHGLLVAAMNPPVERRVLLAHVEESLIIGGQRRVFLATTEYRDGFFPGGYSQLCDFRLDPLPMWRWQVEGCEVTKRLVMQHGRNAVVVQYELSGDLGEKQFVVAPFVAIRNFHHLRGSQHNVRAEADPGALRWRVPIDQSRGLLIQGSAGDFRHEPIWYNQVYYRMEAERKQDDNEDLLRLGEIGVRAAEQQHFSLAAWVDDGEGAPEFAATAKAELQRRQELLDRVGTGGGHREAALVAAADQFLVSRSYRGEPLTSIIAGYPWFADWSRDSMISLPGLCLATGRGDKAREILNLYAGLVDQGMLPNRFEESNADLHFNTVDAALWFVQSAAAYMATAGDDEDFFRDRLWPAIVAIIDNYSRGTRYNIHCDDDGLVIAGGPETQLTWMDAKNAEVVFTPRHGKPVEINALWISALYLSADWAAKYNLNVPNIVLRRHEVREAFNRLFWNAECGCLYDCIIDGQGDSRVRPNQLLAVSLPHAPVDGERGRSIVAVCREKLLTPVGLRTLSPDSPEYKGCYGGNWFERDGCYHQGTAWPWLIGPYIDALMISSEMPSVAHAEAQRVMDDILHALDDGILGSIGEIYDGDLPHAARGCFAQAWSVAEVLRVKRKYGL